MGKTEIIILSIIILMPLAALFDLSRHVVEKAHQFIWVMIIIFIPFFGPISYLIYSRLKYQYKN